MKRLSYFLLLFIATVSFFNCTKDPAPEVAPEDIPFNVSIRKDTTIVLRVNNTFRFIMTPENAKVEVSINPDNTYNNSQTGVVNISEAGEIKAIGPGKANVTLKNNKSYFTFTVVVVELPARLLIIDSLITIKTGKNKQLFNRYLNEYEEGCFGGLKWETSDNSVVQVTNGGFITGLKEGTAKVRVSLINYPAINSIYTVQILDHIVYLAGYCVNENGYIYSATWKNNAGLNLHSGDICGMEFFNENLYQVGYAHSSDIVLNRAFIINNSTKVVFLEAGASASGVTHSGNEIYVCGSYTHKGLRTVALWKNSVLDPILADGEITAESRGMCIEASGGNIFVGGYIKNIQGIQTACYWKNKQRTDLTDGTTNSVVNSLFVDGNDIYAAGSVCISPNSLVSDACYWKNGSKYVLQPARSEAKSIYVYNGDVYIAGSYLNNNNKSMACYWKNGIKYDLPLGNEAVSGYANSIELTGGDVYISGDYHIQGYYTGSNSNKSIGCYWKNGTRYDIPFTSFPGYAGSGYPYSIVRCMTVD